MYILLMLSIRNMISSNQKPTQKIFLRRLFVVQEGRYSRTVGTLGRGAGMHRFAFAKRALTTDY